MLAVLCEGVVVGGVRRGDWFGRRVEEIFVERIGGVIGCRKDFFLKEVLRCGVFF